MELLIVINIVISSFLLVYLVFESYFSSLFTKKEMYVVVKAIDTHIRLTSSMTLEEATQFSSGYNTICNKFETTVMKYEDYKNGLTKLQ